MRIVIVGAGVAGCVMARRLSRLDGVEVICLERVARDDHSEAGTGLNVGPNAVKAVKAVKPEQKTRKIYDERGLFLFVPPTGARLWRMKYKFGGREKLLALGEWPHTSLKRPASDARKRTDCSPMESIQLRKRKPSARR